MHVASRTACLLAVLAAPLVHGAEVEKPGIAGETKGGDPSKPSPTASSSPPPVTRSEASGLLLTPPGAEVALRLRGLLQPWFAQEDLENQRKQGFTGDTGTQESSGFHVRRARISADMAMPGIELRGRLEIRLERTPGLLDGWISWTVPGKYAEFLCGQMKVPATYETATPGGDLDFPTRSQFSAKVVDWSLSKAASLTSPFLGVRTYFRDFGLALKSERFGSRAFLMVGNGLGANLFIGGTDNDQYIHGNAFGAYYYGIRFSSDAVPLLLEKPSRCPVRSVRLGGHASWNRHPDMILGDTRTVVDLSRRSWSLDLTVNVLGRLRLTGLTGAGVIEDDVNNDGKTDYRYRGWELKALGVILPGRLEGGFRFDAYRDETSESGDVKTRFHYTVGITFTPDPHLRIQASYTWRILSSETDPDLNDDRFLLAAQLRL